MNSASTTAKVYLLYYIQFTEIGLPKAKYLYGVFGSRQKAVARGEREKSRHEDGNFLYTITETELLQ